MKKTKKPVILVTGNIASGKTTLCQYIKKFLPELNYLSMDYCRSHQNPQGTLQAEQKANKLFWNLFHKYDALLVESLPLGKTYNNLMREVKTSNYKLLTVVIEEDVQTCKQRFDERKEIQPHPYSFRLEDSIIEIDQILKKIDCDVRDSCSKHKKKMLIDLIMRYFDHSQSEIEEVWD